MKRMLYSLGFFLSIGLSPGFAAGADKGNMKAEQAAAKDHVMVDGSSLIWKDGPPSLPKGTMMTLLEGDMTKQGPFTAVL